jgi:mRNA-degrading endonuclease RelE of RelBE toxin-antitoxin system
VGGGRQGPYQVVVDPEIEGHLRALPVHLRRRVQDVLLDRVAHQPTTETRNRFRMRPNRLATWELRVGPARVYYDVAGDTVRVLAVGRKRGNRVVIGGEEVDLDGEA